MLPSPKKIKKRLIDLELSQAAVARRIGVKRSVVNRVIHRHARSRRVEALLIELLSGNIKLSR